MPRSSLLSLFALATSLAAQGAIVSPVGAATVEGSSSNAFPFGSTVQRRYMQLHSDLGSSPLLITMLSFRANATNATYTGTRVHDFELFMGEGRDALNPSYAFDSNYFSPKTLVIPRTTVTFGPTGTTTTPGPNPFTGNLDIVLPAPFVYTGSGSLIWELTYYGNVSTGTSATTDAEQGIVTSGTSSITGVGCVATGQASAMTHTFTCADIAGTVAMNATVTAGPANAVCILGLGFTNPAMAFPGLCGTVYTDALLTQIIGTTNASGAITTDTAAMSTLVVPNQLAGLSLFSQVFAIDVARPDPIPFTCSNGRTVIVPAPNLTRVNRATRIFNNAGGTTATEGIYFTSTIGYALVTQFSHL